VYRNCEDKQGYVSYTANGIKLDVAPSAQPLAHFAVKQRINRKVCKGRKEENAITKTRLPNKKLYKNNITKRAGDVGGQ